MHIASSSTYTRQSTFPSTTPDRRGVYNELISVGDTLAEVIIGRYSECLPMPFIALDRKGRGDALNLDLYGYDPDQGVAIIQVRQYYKRAARHYGSTRKTYVLCGFNETGSAFRHPIAHGPVHGAVRSGQDPAGVVRAAQRWMWDVTERQLGQSIRQGDVLLVPERRTPRNDNAIDRGDETVLAGTHVVRANRILEINERIHALNPTLTHTKDQHAPVSVPRPGWWTVRVAREADAWDFSARLGD